MTRAQCYVIVARRAKGRCERCGVRISERHPEWHPLRAHLNHVTPLSKGGEDTPENCELICGSCHMPNGRHAPTAARGERLQPRKEWP